MSESGVQQGSDTGAVHELIARQAQIRPDAVALVAGPIRLTYRELDQQANRLAHFLHARGVGPEIPVALCLERGAHLIVGLLGILKAGGVLVPLDPKLPRERLTFMVQDTGAPVVLTQESLTGLIAETGADLIRMDTDDSVISARPATEPERLAGPEHLAYVVYTSGSTGTPNGVMVEHRSLCGRMTQMRYQYGLTAEDVFLQFASIAFDGALGQILPPLIAGATLVVREERWEPQWLLDTCARHAVTVCELPPAAWALLIDKLRTGGTLASSLRLLSLGGDRVLPGLVERWFTLSAVPLLNVYGPSEATVTTTTALIEQPRAEIPIGRPIGNTEVFVVDRQGQVVPTGVVGELWVGGAGLARGYLNRPDLTAARFVVRSVDGVRRRLYRTGDLVRWLPDGCLAFVGRVDDQVKVHGHRVEPGEVESVLVRNPAVGSCAVVARELTPGDTRLFAYCVPLGDAEPRAPELREWCARSLPDFMVPSGFVILAELPVTGNGKVDRAALPMPTEQRPDLAVRFVPPCTPTERALARVWVRVLRIEQVGRHDRFFELGGDSLLSIQLIAEARRHGIRLSSRVIFENDTLAGMAAHARHGETTLAGKGEGP